MNFDFAAAIAARPASDTASLIRHYGNPKGPGWSAAPGSGPSWFNPSPTWKRQNAVLIPLAQLPGFPPCPYGKLRGVTMHRLVAPIFLATWLLTHERGQTRHLRTFDGSAAYRHMGHNPRRDLSVHAFLAAVDFDAVWNGYGVPLERMQIDKEFVRTWEECGWTWGGRWTGEFADGMHFQWTDPVPGVRLAEWQDAARHPTTPLIVKPRPEVPLSQGYLYGPARSPDMAPTGDWVSIAVDGSGVPLVDAQGHARTVVFDEARARAKGLVK
ncbi:D-alanyl-D-alanine carboxypeptidase [Deinococcus reticulitermitis]|uniref:D-alanyl-D-alanine carboxypeptidase n=1 Tax=Deinococcus reticulitermitis TaxID=856736 RepID=A0A1H6SEP9_9DEIO|nr:M15 family metallopeptidase [Deinococcus reticulitermitis]SEI66379.1 D-alanyl-D-alanine carboxypeptidase [Deinococcus reticulitermitis]